MDDGGRRIRSEVGIGFVALSGVAALVFFPHLANGAFVSDDWTLVADSHFAASPRFFTSIQEFSRSSGGGRPLLSVLRSIQITLLGPHPGAQIAFGLLLGIVTCLCFFVFLRTLGMKAAHAGAIAVLAFLFPWADSIRLWATASINTAAIAFYFLAATLAIRALSFRGLQGALIHVGAIALYLASVLTYEAAGVAACLTGLLYLRRAPRSIASRRWVSDVVVVVVALGWSAQHKGHIQPLPSASQSLASIPTFIRQDLSLLAWSLFPFHTSSELVRRVALLVAAIVVFASARQARRSERTELRYWLLVGTIAVVAIAAATVPLLGGYLHPVDSGILNRGNIFAAFPFAVLVYALVMAATRVIDIGTTGAMALGFTIIAVISLGYIVRLYDDEDTWRSAARAQQAELASIDHQLPRLPTGSSVVTFGYPGDFVRGLPIFDSTWDLAGALRLRRQDNSLRAFPLFEEGQPHCGRTGFQAVFRNESTGLREIGYTKLFFVSPQAAARIADGQACQEALRHVQPGPYLLQRPPPR